MKTLTLILAEVLALGCTLNAANVSLFADGTIDQALRGAYPFVDAGDSFRLSISYSDGWADTETRADLGTYLVEDLSITLEIIDEGVAFRSLGGSISVFLDPMYDAVLQISSYLPDGNALYLVFQDYDHSSVLDDHLPTSFGSITDYDWVAFAVKDLPALWPTPPDSVNGRVSSLSVPEPHTLSLVGFGLAALLLSTNPLRQPECRTSRCTE